MTLGILPKVLTDSMTDTNMNWCIQMVSQKYMTHGNNSEAGGLKFLERSSLM